MHTREGSTDSSWQHCLSNVLPRLTNLVILEFHRGLDPQRFPLAGCSDIFQSCAFQLRSLTCTFPLNTNFATFLETQFRLTHLRWYPLSRPSAPLSRGSLPELAFLDIETHAQPMDELIPRIIVGQPVAYLRSSADWTDYSLRVFQLTTSSPLRAIELCFTPELLGELPVLFPELGTEVSPTLQEMGR
jgi:hypothetical protein